MDLDDNLAAAVAEGSPEQTEETGESQDFGELCENLPEDKLEELRSVIQTCAKRDQWARMVEIIRCTLRRYFWLGIQHGFWNADAQQFQVGPGGAPLGGENVTDEDLFQGDFNIYTQNGKIFIAVFSQNAASSRMEPDKPGDPASVKASAEAEKYVRVYQKYNPPKMAQQEVGRLLWTDGRVVSVTSYEEDEDLGTEEDADGAPMPRGTESTRYFGVLETKVPLIEPYKRWPYCKVSQEIDIFTAKFENPVFAAKIQQGAKGLNPNDELARMSRIATAENISQVSSDTLAHMVTEDTWYLRPSAFMDLAPDKRGFWIGDEQNPGLFPKGCKVKYFGSVFAGAKACAMSDEVRCMHAMPGNGNARPSLSDAMIPIQMEFNDAVGMYSEMIHKCIPRIWVNAEPEEIAAILEQVSRYGEYSPFSNETQQPLEQQFFAEPNIEVPSSFPQWVENLQGPLSQFVTGNSPALFGQQMEDQKTAHGYAQARDQSLGLMALVWVPYLQFAASIRGQAARCAGRRDSDSIAAVIQDAKGNPDTIKIDLSVMRAGSFLCTPVTDQNFPESWTETSNTWKTLIAAAPSQPIIAENLQEPDNLVAMRDAIGLKDLVIKGADSRDLQLSEWAKMQENEGPVPDLAATQARDQQRQQAAQQAVNQLAPGQSAPELPGMPPVLSSSVPIDEDTDDHVVHALEMFRILNSPEGQKIKQQSPEIWQDGKLHMLAHVAAAKNKGLMIPPPLGSAPMPAAPIKPALAAAASALNASPLLQGAANATTIAPAV